MRLKWFSLLFGIVTSEKEEHVECPSGDWFKVGSRCFRVMPRRADWYDALVGCAKEGALLATVHTPEDEQFLKKITNKLPNCHIGLRRFRGSNGGWYWLDEFDHPANKSDYSFSEICDPQSTDPLDACGNSGQSPSNNGNSVIYDFGKCTEKDQSYICSTLPSDMDMPTVARRLWAKHEESGDFVRLREFMFVVGVPIPTAAIGLQYDTLPPTAGDASTAPTTADESSEESSDESSEESSDESSEESSDELYSTEDGPDENPPVDYLRTNSVDWEASDIIQLLSGPSIPAKMVSADAGDETRQKYTVLFVAAACSLLLIGIIIAGAVISRRKHKSVPSPPEEQAVEMPIELVTAEVEGEGRDMRVDVTASLFAT